MSIQSEIERISGNIAGAYAAVAEKGVEVPGVKNSANLAEAVRAISGPYQAGGGISIEGNVISANTVQVVDVLPSIGETGVIYAVPHRSVSARASAPTNDNGNNNYDEYMYINGDWEVVGQDKLPSGGAAGQVLAKASDTDGDVEWQDVPESGLTQDEADNRYLKLSGGTMTGAINANQHDITDIDTIGMYGFAKPYGSVAFLNDRSKLSYVRDKSAYNGGYSDYEWCFGKYGQHDRLNADRVRVGTPVDDYHAATKKYVDDAVASAIPAGCILIWSGAADAVPGGWALCDGENGTPDLRDRFVVGAGSEYLAGATGGEATHTLTIYEMPHHDHYLRGYTVLCETLFPGANYKVYCNDDNPPRDCITDLAGGGQPHNNLPPYYALCYIMKL